jgi:hypothetical protein
MKVYDDSGAEVDATFAVTRTGTGCVLTFESRGPGGPGGRNTQYNLGLQRLIARLGALGATLEDALLASSTVRHEPEAERRLDLPDAHPILLSTVDAAAFQRLLGGTLAGMARQPGAAGRGNPQKRIELVVTLPTYTGSESELEFTLAFGGVPEPQRTVTPRRSRTARRAGRKRAQRYLTAVERHAVAIAESWYTKQGYAVENVGLWEPWDLEARRGDELRRVEVKGSAGTRATVNLTVGGVESAEAWSPTDLIVVDGIALSEVDGVIKTSGGQVRRWAEWRPHYGRQSRRRARRPGHRTFPRTGSGAAVARSTTSALARSPKSPSSWATRSASRPTTTSTRSPTTGRLTARLRSHAYAAERAVLGRCWVERP